MSKLNTHVWPFIYNMDDVFAGRREQDVNQRYVTLQGQRMVMDDMLLVLVVHKEFGGITSAVHVLWCRNIDNTVFCPYNVLHQSLVHVLSLATHAYGAEIGESTVMLPPYPRHPIVENGALQVEGLLDV